MSRFCQLEVITIACNGSSELDLIARIIMGALIGLLGIVVLLASVGLFRRGNWGSYLFVTSALTMLIATTFDFIVRKSEESMSDLSYSLMDRLACIFATTSIFCLFLHLWENKARPSIDLLQNKPLRVSIYSFLFLANLLLAVCMIGATMTVQYSRIEGRMEEFINSESLLIWYRRTTLISEVTTIVLFLCLIGFQLLFLKLDKTSSIAHDWYYIYFQAIGYSSGIVRAALSINRQPILIRRSLLVVEMLCFSVLVIANLSEKTSFKQPIHTRQVNHTNHLSVSMSGTSNPGMRNLVLGSRNEQLSRQGYPSIDSLSTSIYHIATEHHTQSVYSNSLIHDWRSEASQTPRSKPGSLSSKRFHQQNAFKRGTMSTSHKRTVSMESNQTLISQIGRVLDQQGYPKLSVPSAAYSRTRASSIRSSASVLKESVALSMADEPAEAFQAYGTDHRSTYRSNGTGTSRGTLDVGPGWYPEDSTNMSSEGESSAHGSHSDFKASTERLFINPGTVEQKHRPQTPGVTSLGMEKMQAKGGSVIMEIVDGYDEPSTRKLYFEIENPDRPLVTTESRSTHAGDSFYLER